MQLTRPQAKFLQMDKRFRAYVGGYGAGKTFVGSTALCQHLWAHPKINIGYFSPTYPIIRDVFYSTIDEVGHGMGLKIKVNQSNKEVHAYSGRTYRGTIICRSMNLPESIIGFKIGHALIDELDVLPVDKARLSWRKILARMRYKEEGVRNGVDVCTTPEGFRFVYDQFKVRPTKDERLSKSHGLVQASTYENEKFLPVDYIPSLLADYPSQLVQAYLMGQFVNLTEGSVYREFDRTLNNSNEVILPGEPLHIGMDFNVSKMAAIVHVLRGAIPHAAEELTKVFDTPTMITTLKSRYPNRPITIYPDASGDSRKTNNASVSDISLLRTAGFTVLNNAANPYVKDRVLAVNARICLGGERRYFVNVAKCPDYTDALEKQVYDKNGEPDKTAGYDHPADAGGYFIAHRFPIASQKARLVKLGGM